MRVWKCTRLPITTEILAALLVYWSSALPFQDATMLWAAACLCFYGFLCAGEICTPPSPQAFNPHHHLSPHDIELDSKRDPTMFKVHIKHSKTNQFGQGVKIVIGASGHTICPLAVILQYLSVKGLSPGPLFQFNDGRPLSKSTFVAAVRQGLQAIGVDMSLYGGHSFRIGAATTATSAGTSDSLIKTMG